MARWIYYCKVFKGGNFNGSISCYQCSLETNSHEFCAYSTLLLSPCSLVVNDASGGSGNPDPVLLLTYFRLQFEKLCVIFLLEKYFY